MLAFKNYKLLRIRIGFYLATSQFMIAHSIVFNDKLIIVVRKRISLRLHLCLT